MIDLPKFSIRDSVGSLIGVPNKGLHVEISRFHLLKFGNSNKQNIRTSKQGIKIDTCPES